MSGADTTSAAVLAVLIADQADSLVSRRVGEVEVSLEGLNGDKHAGFTRRADGRTPNYPRGTRIRNDRQVSLVSYEELQLVAERLEVEEVQPEWLGANLLVGGIPGLSTLPHNTRLRFSGGVVLVVQAGICPVPDPGACWLRSLPDRNSSGISRPARCTCAAWWLSSSAAGP